ncbi:MAG: WYL domain-containing protein [Phycisphaeraceae bacterium]|nr:WYL domain-containing protein [Phycisphaeraceae bacterium]
MLDKTKRIQRLLRLISLLQSSRARSAVDLAVEMNVSRRTLFRDLEVLQKAGIPCYHQTGHGYRIAQSFFLPPISLTVPETLGLLLLAHTARATGKGPLRQAALSAVNKLLTSVPDPIRTVCAELTQAVSINPTPQPGTDADAEANHYLALHRCIDEGRACRILYESPVEDKPLDCLLEPYALHFSAVSWYVLGKTDVHKQVRVLKLARIRQLEPTPKLFRKPKNFSVQEKLGRAWRLIPEGEIHHVELEFAPKVATNVSEVLWHPSQKSTILPDGRCRMTFDVDGLSEIAWWLCGYADQVRVIAPPALRQRVAQMHKQAWTTQQG